MAFCFDSCNGLQKIHPIYLIFMKHKKDGLESKVFKFKHSNIKEDESGKYIPICHYHWHRGLIQDEEVCLKRNCDHYDRLYFLVRPKYLKR